MIIMKLRYKILIPVIIVLLIKLFIVLLSLSDQPKDVFYVIKKHYSIICDDYPKLELIVFTNSNHNDYLKQENIAKTTIYNNDDFYKTEITNIGLLEGKKTIKGTEYYQYKMELKFNFEIEQMFNISDAKLEIIYSTDEKLLLNVGNICFVKHIKNNTLSIDKVQSICNDLGNLESLVSVKLSVKNDLDKKITIKSIKTISSSINVNNNYLYVDEYNTSIDHSSPLSQIFGSQFNLYAKSTNSFNPIDLDQNTAKDIIIPLTYTQKEFVDHLGFIIELEYDDQIIFQTVNPYLLFSTSNLEYVLYEYEIINNRTI